MVIGGWGGRVEDWALYPMILLHQRPRKGILMSAMPLRFAPRING